MDTPNPNFEEILAEVQRTRKSIKTYPYVATEYLGVARRGWRVVEKIEDLLDKYDVLCEPEFGSAWFYGTIEIKPNPKISSGKTDSAVGEAEDRDPTPRLSLLRAANLNKVKEAGSGAGLVSVKKDTTLTEAITLMLLHDFSQLPILSSQREVDGIVSWRSIGKALSLGKNCTTVFECKEDVITLNYDEPLFSAVKFVLEKEVVLVRQKDRVISGIVTATDIGEQFIALAEPFLIIEQIENHIRRLLDQKFSREELKVTNSIEEPSKEIKSLSDLTFGQYVRIVEDPKKFAKLQLNVDRVLIVKQLDQVRKIRNDVMHFDPDGITPQNLDLLRQTASFLHTVTAAIR